MTKAMDITGIESVVFGVEDIAECRRFLGIYGLSEIENIEQRSVWEALDGSSVELRYANDPSLPTALVPGSTGRRYIWGVRSPGVLEEIAAELSSDRPVRFEDGELHTSDDDGHVLTFRVSRRRPYDAQLPSLNVAGAEPGRALNRRVDFDGTPKARAMGHIVFWSHDPERSLAFWVDRLGFRITDQISGNTGAFIRAHGHSDHHSAFFIAIKDRPFEPSLQHLEFHFGDVQEMMMVGDQLTRAGFQTGFGPGRHRLGSNWYWYFRSPLGCAFEVAADMDQADENWEPGVCDTLDDSVGWSLNYTGGVSAMAARDAKLAVGENVG